MRNTHWGQKMNWRNRMDDVLMSDTPLSAVKVLPGVNFTHAGKVFVSLRAWARLRVWGPEVWRISSGQVKVVPASAPR
jgi:hypothetical protein